jgi:hypothetical protein
MEKVLKKTELLIHTENKVGVLDEISGLIADSGANIENICAYTMGARADFFILTDDNDKAEKKLTGKGYRIEKREVIVVGLWNRPGALSHAARLFKEKGINLQTVYGTSSPKGERTTIIFCAEDNQKASEVFDSLVVWEENE